MLGLGIFAAVIAIYELVADPAERVGISRPLAFVVAGAIAALTGAVEPLPGGEPAGLLLALAELALALVLFADASRVDLAGMRRGATISTRLLGPGMLLSIGLGTLVGLWLFPGLDTWECAVLAAVLAPTDAALGAVVVADERVPKRIRETLNVEAGLNDGLAVPFVLLFVAGATVAEGIEPASFWATTVVEKVGIGLLAGTVVGTAGGEIVRRARRRGWSSAASEQLATAGIVVALFVFTEELGGSGFISAFVGGLFAGARLGAERRQALEFTEREGDLAGAFVFFVLGLVAVELLDDVGWEMCLYAVLALTIVRMTAVAVALLGSGLRWPTVAFVGWFGPRGLASIVLALVVLDQDQQLTNIGTVVMVTLLTVILSVVAHGVSATPLSARYGRWSATLPPSARERNEAL